MLRFLLPILVFFTPLHAQEQACLAKPEPLCLIELAKTAALQEKEGWGYTGLYEMLLTSDPDLARREKWLEEYINFASNTKIEGIKERIPAVKAEHYARLGKFSEAYKALGLTDGKEDPYAEPSVLIIDEAKAGNLNDALLRVAKMVEEDSRDDVFLELLNVAIEQKSEKQSTIYSSIKDVYNKRLAQSTLWGAAGNIKAFQHELEIWVKGAKESNEFPFDKPDNARRESWDSYIQGAILAGNKDAFAESLATRGAFATSDENEAVGKMVRPLIKKGLSDWLKLAAPHIRLPAGETVAAEEDVYRLKTLTTEQLKGNVEAVENIPALKAPMVDQVVDVLLQKGDIAAAVDYFIEKGRADVLNTKASDQDRVAPLFETLYRMSHAKKLPQEAILKAKLTSDNAKEFYAKIDGLDAKIEQLTKAELAIEPNEDDWSLIVDLLLQSRDFSKMALVSSRIKDAGLRTSAFTQTARAMLEYAR